MKAITIQQPYAHLIVNRQVELPQGAIEKPCENRTWKVKYRGLIIIHAGVSRKWFQYGDWPAEQSSDDMAFGAFTGFATLAEIYSFDEIPSEHELYSHHHAVGPFCWWLQDRHRFVDLIPAVGKQGLWSPDALQAAKIDAAIERVRCLK